MIKKTNKSLKYPFLLMLLIFIESSIYVDGSEYSLNFLMAFNPQFQNLLHIPLYGFLCLLWLSSFKNFAFSVRKNIFYSFLLTSFYGIFDEIHQTFVPGRYGGLIDILLNALGAVLAIILFMIIQHIKYEVPVK